MENDCVVILVGGQGSRLKPYTTVLPKPLIPVGDVPILEVVVNQLRDSGFRRLIFATNYRDGLVRSYFGNGDAYGVEIIYSKEAHPLGTVGPLHLVAEHLPETFLMMNGDILTDLNYRDLFDTHEQSGGLLTLGTYTRRVQVADGVLDINESGLVTGFREKPVIPLPISLGAYAMSRDVLNHIPTDCAFGMDDLVQHFIKQGIAVNTFRHDGRWLDIGCPQDLERANELFTTERTAFLSDIVPTNSVDPANARKNARITI